MKLLTPMFAPIATVLSSAVLLAACSSQPEKNIVSVEDDLQGKTIENIRPVGIRLAKMPAPDVNTKEAIRRYQRYLEIAPKDDTRVHVLHRLADLKLMDIEELIVEDPENVDPKYVKEVYQQAIDTYAQVFDLFPNRRDSDMLLYQLAKAHMLKGDQDAALATLTKLSKSFPDSELVTEVEYRRGDILFNSEQYAGSEKAFQYVMDQGKDTRFYSSASYMRGWTQFKQDKHSQALASFVDVIDSRFPSTSAVVTASRGDRELLDDTLRVMAMIFADGQGYRQANRLFKKVGTRHFEYLVYDGLGEFYMKKGQYSDAAKTYLSFVTENPKDVLASTFYGNAIKSYKRAGYIDQVLKHKMAYIEKYGANSIYWTLYGEDIKEMIRPNLKTYIAELAQYHHSKGQKSKNLSKRFNGLLAAARWYQEYIDTFPEDQNLGEMYFLMGEAYYDVGRYDDSVAAYEQGGFKTPAHKSSEESGYAALVAYNQLIKNAKTKEEKDKFLSKKVDTALQFVDTYPSNRNVPQVLARASEGFFNLSRYELAANTAQRVLDLGNASAKQRSVSYSILGHSHFDLKNFANAESAYLAVLDLKIIDKKERKNVREKLAASIYKQGVAIVEQEKVSEADLKQAVRQFMRVGKVVPESPIRITAHYDAASYLMKREGWKEAIPLLLSFRKTFAKNKLAKDIPSKLIIAYEKTEQWKKAAFELEQIWRHSKDAKEQRIALYQAAEYFEKGGDIKSSMNMLKRYAHNYPKPFNAQLEAINKLEALYLKQGDHEKRRYWLAKLITADKKAGKDRTDRSRFLAAKASFELADYERQVYAAIPLTLPLQKSLGKKKVALKKTLDAYQRTAKMEVQEFTTAATFQIAEIYGELSRDLMNSERPPGLDELELEEYEYLLEDQAFPFEEAAINIHETNIKRSWDGLYDGWISKSISALGKLMPARYAKEEVSYDVIAEIH